MSTATAIAFEKGLPSAVDAERLVLGAVQLDGARYWDECAALTAEDFTLEAHRHIWAAMQAIQARGESIDRVIVYTELFQRGRAESVGGLSYLVSLDEGLPQFAAVDSYVRLLQNKTVLRQTIRAAQQLMNRCFRDEEPAVDIVASAVTSLRGLADSQIKHGEWVQPLDVLENWPGGIQGFLDRPNGGVGIETPWPSLTEALAGLHRGDLFVIAGRPSMGKTVAGLQMAHWVALQGLAVPVFSLEMSKESLVERLIACNARVDLQRIRTGRTDARERERIAAAVEQLDRVPLRIDDTRARTMSAIQAALRKFPEREQIGMIVIDHLQLTTSAGRRPENRMQELTDFLHDAKHEAGRMNAIVVLLSQLNRQCEIENRRPQLSDLKQTGTLEEDADVVLFVHRPERYMKNRDRDDLRGIAEFIIAKQRNGPTGKLGMVFISEQQRFEMRATGFRDQEGTGYDED